MGIFGFLRGNHGTAGNSRGEHLRQGGVELHGLKLDEGSPVMVSLRMHFFKFFNI